MKIFAVLGSLVWTACSLFDSPSCTAEQRLAPCITINGLDSIDPSYSVYRSYKGEISSPTDERGRCFSGQTGKMTLFVMEGDRLVAQKQVTVKKAEDGCHAEFTTVNFDIPE